MEAWVYDITYEKSGNDKKGTRVRITGRTTFQEIFLSVQEGDYPIERAAQKAGMDIQSVEKAMVDAGYKIPECV